MPRQVGVTPIVDIWEGLHDRLSNTIVQTVDRLYPGTRQLRHDALGVVYPANGNLSWRTLISTHRTYIKLTLYLLKSYADGLRDVLCSGKELWILWTPQKDLTQPSVKQLRTKSICGTQFRRRRRHHPQWEPCRQSFSGILHPDQWGFQEAAQRGAWPSRNSDMMPATSNEQAWITDRRALIR